MYLSKTFHGVHELRRMNSSSSRSSSELNGSFFLGSGSVTGSGETEDKVTFAWKSVRNNRYIISSIPIEKFEVQFDERIEIPTIRFVLWERAKQMHFNHTPQDALDKTLASVVLTCQEDQWNPTITLPMD